MQEQHPITGILARRDVLSVTGSAAAPFLQGLLTQDVLTLTAPTYSFLLSPNGRLLADFYLYPMAEGVYIDVAQTLSEKLITKLNQYKLRQPINISRQPSLHVCVTGLNRFISPELSDAVDDTHRLLSLENGHFDGQYDYKFEEDVVADVINDRQPAICSTKGCYIGQELTSRMLLKSLGKKELVVVPHTETSPYQDQQIRAIHPPYATVMRQRI